MRYTDNVIFLVRITIVLILGPGNDNVTRSGHMGKASKAFE